MSVLNKWGPKNLIDGKEEWIVDPRMVLFTTGTFYENGCQISYKLEWDYSDIITTLSARWLFILFNYTRWLIFSTFLSENDSWDFVGTSDSDWRHAISVYQILIRHRVLEWLLVII